MNFFIEAKDPSRDFDPGRNRQTTTRSWCPSHMSFIDTLFFDRWFQDRQVGKKFDAQNFFLEYIGKLGN
jgi:hypothetical protein